MAMRMEGRARSWLCVRGSKSRDGVTCEEWMAASVPSKRPIISVAETRSKLNESRHIFGNRSQAMLAVIFDCKATQSFNSSFPQPASPRPGLVLRRLGPAGANDKMMPSEHPREQNACALVDTTHQQMQHQHRHPVLFAMPVPRYHAIHERRPGAPFPPKHS
jgi:hypothetical protein